MPNAPVLLNMGDNLAVAGVVVGVDTVEYGGVPQNVGIAMIADEIAGLSSARLGGPIAARLDFNGAQLTVGPQP
jgi:hypothetical protein